MIPKIDYTKFVKLKKTDEMQKILLLLCEFETMSGRAVREETESENAIRKAISLADSDSVEFWVHPYGETCGVYFVIAEMRQRNARACVYWVHEDGIWRERREHADDKDHPVHATVCLTDLLGSRRGLPEHLHEFASLSDG